MRQVLTDSTKKSGARSQRMKSHDQINFKAIQGCTHLEALARGSIKIPSEGLWLPSSRRPHLQPSHHRKTTLEDPSIGLLPEIHRTTPKKNPRSHDSHASRPRLEAVDGGHPARVHEVQRGAHQGQVVELRLGFRFFCRWFSGPKVSEWWNISRSASQDSGWNFW